MTHQDRPPGARRSLTDLFELLPDGIVVADADGTLLAANRRAEQLTGLDLRAEVGTEVERALPLHDREHRDVWSQLLPWGDLTTRTRIPEQLLHVPRGEVVLLTAAFDRDPDRSLRRLVITLRDARTRERSEADTAALVAATAHELRAPLSSVRGFGRTLRDRWDVLSDEQKQWMLEAIDHDAGRLSRLVAELLDLSRLDSGRLTLHPEPVDLGALVRDRVSGLIAEGYPADRFEVDAAAAQLVADRDRLSQVVDNLLRNAVTHGAGQVRVEVRRQDDGDDPALVLRVADQGQGVPEEYRDAAFTRFWHGGGQRGSGLGLSVVRGLVEAHGGVVDLADNAPGALVTVRLPLRAPGPESGFVPIRPSH